MQFQNFLGVPFSSGGNEQQKTRENSATAKPTQSNSMPNFADQHFGQRVAIFVTTDKPQTTEKGAFIPRKLFGENDQILGYLNQVGVLSGREVRQVQNKIKVAPYIDRSLEMEWIKNHKKEFAGKWVALQGSRLICHGNNAEIVFATARSLGIEAPFFAHLEPNNALPFGGW